MSFYPSLNNEEIEIIPAEPVSDSYKCVKCHEILRDPVQTTCGCRLCKMCALSAVENQDPAPCPGRSEFCEKISMRHDPYIVMDDKATRKDLARIKVKCPFNCKTIIKLCELKDHVEKCNLKSTECPYCHKRMLLQELQTHEQDCPKRVIKCNLCSKEILRKEEKVHYNLQHSKCCDNYSVKCPYCITGKFTRYTIVSHKEWCPNKSDWKLLCPFDFLNCDKIFDNKNDLKNHVEEDLTYHLNLSLKMVEGQRKYLSELTTKIDSAKTDITALERKCNLCDNWARKCDEALRRHSSYDGIQTSSQRLQVLNLSSPTVLESIDEVLRQPALHRGSVFIWRISNFKHLQSRADRADSLTTTFSIFSPPFYTSDFGYKVCLRAYPNGDGSGKKEYFSLFIVILSGDYDNIQVWPFNKLVNLTILDQRDKRNVSEKFRADPNSPCFDKPTNRRYNIATGCPKFLPKNRLSSNFISDNENGTIYIQAKFD